MVSHVQVTSKQMEKENSYGREKEIGRALINKKKSVTLLWLSYISLSLSELLQERRGSLSSSYWTLLLSGGVRAPSSGLPTLF